MGPRSSQLTEVQGGTTSAQEDNSCDRKQRAFASTPSSKQETLIIQQLDNQNKERLQNPSD